MKKPVRYYIQKSGDQPLVRSVPVTVPQCAALAHSRQERELVSPVVVKGASTRNGRARLWHVLQRDNR